MSCVISKLDRIRKEIAKLAVEPETRYVFWEEGEPKPEVGPGDIIFSWQHGDEESKGGINEFISNKTEN